MKLLLNVPAPGVRAEPKKGKAAKTLALAASKELAI